MADKKSDTSGQKPDQTQKPSPPSNTPPPRSTYIKEDRGIAWDSGLPEIKDTAEPPPPTPTKKKD
jgi:hypothetical protein